jgi:glycerophosphoryl diester phosphodiesterase
VEVVIASLLRIGHRGACGHAPENTLASIWKARACHADLIEVDLRETSDGHLVLLHDESVDRTTNKTGLVAEMTLDQLQRLNAGNWQRIPTLEEALEIANGALGLVLELKVNGIGAEAGLIVKRSGFTGPLIYASFLLDELQRLRQADPSAQVMVLLGDPLPPDPVVDAVTIAATHVGLPYGTVTPPLLQTYRNLDKRVFVYTVNDPQDIQRMRDVGVDGIISDFPDRI